MRPPKYSYITRSEIYLNHNLPTNFFEEPNLLGLYPEVEKDHFKLWMSNTFIIERILHNKEYALSDFEKSEIEDTIKYYVSNQSFSEALEIIKSNNFVIISGIPGIGKTTLARVIVYHFLSKDYDEFVYISESIDDALKLFREDKKQVFFYDDFLGSNFLREMLSKNEDKRIRTFIERVKKSKNKILILTTREYILNQAKKEYEIFNSNQFDLVKCVIDLSKYNRSIRAKILYNHIFFSGIPHSYILNILDNKNYLNIIDHQNYSPRIISIITKEEKIWESIKAEDFTNKFIEYLDYPQAIWKHAFENQISYLSRMILIQLCVSGTPILIKNLMMSTNFFIEDGSKSTSLKFNPKFNSCIKELENTFITTQTDSKGNIAVLFQNKSINDFLIEYIKNNTYLIKKIIENAIYFNQLFSLFRTKRSKYRIFPIILEGDCLEVLKVKILKEFHKMENIEVLKVNYVSGKNEWNKWKDHKFHKIELLCEHFDIESDTEIRGLLLEEFDPILTERLSYSEASAYLNILKILHQYFPKRDFQIMDDFFEKARSVSDLDLFTRFKDIYKNTYHNFRKKKDDPHVVKKMDSLIRTDLKYRRDSPDSFDLDHFKNEVISVTEAFEIENSNYISEIYEIFNKKSEMHKNDKISNISTEIKTEENSYNEDADIFEMFNSLLEIE